MNKKVNLNTFSNKEYKPGSLILRVFWYLVNSFLFKSYILPFSTPKKIILILFGAKIGKNFVIRNNVNIKYPWHLTIGDNCWIGEGVWIDNLYKVDIKNDVCISQGALILSGNHNYKKTSFDLILKPIIIESGVWVGAKSIICQGVILNSHSVICAGSFINNDTEKYSIYSGNPSKLVRKRTIS